jgi:hypothetical protein
MRGDMSDIFIEQVWPLLGKKYCEKWGYQYDPNGVTRTQNDPNAALYEQDVIGGKDYQYNAGSEMFSIAYREQTTKPYRTFTVRYQIQRCPEAKTEWHKRINAVKRMEKGHFVDCPEATVQSYVSSGKVVLSAICRTYDLYKYIIDIVDNHDYKVGYFRPKTARAGNNYNEFRVIEWDDMQAYGVPILIYSAQ